MINMYIQATEPTNIKLMNIILPGRKGNEKRKHADLWHGILIIKFLLSMGVYNESLLI